MEVETKQRKKRLEYKWVIVACCFAMIFTCLGFCSSNKSLYLSAITEALGIKRSLFSINDSIRFIATAVVNLFFGTLVQKFGARKMIGAGFVSLIAAVLIYAHATEVWMFYIGGALLGIGLSWASTTMVGYVVNYWCKEHKGTIMGFVLAANGIGGALAAQIVTPIIYEEGNAFGYRSAYKLVALILLVVGIVIVALFRDIPKDSRGDVPKKNQKEQGWIGITFEQAMRKPYFYMSLCCIFLTGAVLQAVNGIGAAHMRDVGVEAGYLATVMSVHSLVLTASKFLTGFLYDKLGIRFTMIFCDVAAVVAFLTLALVSPTAEGRWFAMLYGAVSAFALPLETIMLPLISGELFGQIAYAQMMGLFVSVNTAGYAVGAPVANLVYDIFGTYKPILYVSVVIIVMVAVVFQGIFTTVKKMQNEMPRERR